jgi:hypothetical protein
VAEIALAADDADPVDALQSRRMRYYEIAK